MHRIKIILKNTVKTSGTTLNKAKIKLYCRLKY